MDALTPLGMPCPGPLRRREFLRLGLAGLGSLTWPEVLRRRAEAGAGRPRQDTALLVVWLHGGASHLETYDPKPLAPAEYRGPYRPIPSRVPGLHVSELLPRHAQVAHRFTLLRSLAGRRPQAGRAARLPRACPPGCVVAGHLPSGEGAQGRAGHPHRT